MSDGKAINDKDEKKSEHKYLTLADKKPSFIKKTGNESTSARTISTRELSDNLQRTRDGLINLMRKEKENEGFRRYGSDDESDNDFEKFGMPVRIKKSRAGGNEAMNRSSLYEITNEKKGKRGEIGSEEFSNIHSNRAGESNMGMRRGKNAQRGRHSSGSNMDRREDYDKYGKNFFDKNDKRFNSQNPKKDGPLFTRIFIDAFLPTLEGNRISPLFNYHCSEKIERADHDFYERNKKRLNKQLAAVSSTDENANENREDANVQEIQKVEENNVKEVRELYSSKNIQELPDRYIVEEIQELEKVQKIQELQGRNVQKVEELHTEHEVVALERVQEVYQRNEEVSSGKERTKSDNTNAIHGSAEDDHNKSKPNERTNEAAEHVASTKEDKPSGDEDKPPTKDDEPSTKEDKPSTKEEKPSTKEDKLPAKEDKSPTNEAKPPTNEHRSSAKEDKLSTEEDNLMQRVLRSLLENDELVDFFCEKVVSKIAARNDFCGPNCKGKCGGLNKPSEGNAAN